MLTLPSMLAASEAHPESWPSSSAAWSMPQACVE
jgi:hypothetical protein